MILTPEEKQLSVRLGTRLRTARVAHRMTQAELGSRVGVSRQVIAKMEQGDAGSGLGAWIRASVILGLATTWEELLSAPPDPFAEFDAQRQAAKRLQTTRVRRKK